MSDYTALVLGVGGFAQSYMRVLREAGASVACWLSRDYGHWAPRQEGRTVHPSEQASPLPLLDALNPTLVIPQSIDWARQPWAKELARRVPVLCPTADGLKLERDRDYARGLCSRFGIPFPHSHVARSHEEALTLLAAHPGPYVLKNPLCGPHSPVHTIVCETEEETRRWLAEVNYAEGVFLQEYAGRREIGHIALVSHGELHSLVTNQEYKRAFAGNLGVVAGAPLGGLVEQDPGDRYGLARQLLTPLLPWFRETGFHGPVQVTAAFHRGQWQVLEYNVRLGVTSGPLILRLLENPLEVLHACARNEPLKLRWRPGLTHGCNLTLAGFGYPYTQLTGPRVPVTVDGAFDCDVWWNEVDAGKGGLDATGHRICDVCAPAGSLEEAIRRAYANLRRIHSLGSYYRPDVGQSLWPPGND